MKHDILFVANGDADSNVIIAEAAKQTGCGWMSCSLVGQSGNDYILPQSRYRIMNFTVRAVGARNPATAAAPL